MMFNKIIQQQAKKYKGKSPAPEEGRLVIRPETRYNEAKKCSRRETKCMI